LESRVESRVQLEPEGGIEGRIEGRIKGRIEGSVSMGKKKGALGRSDTFIPQGGSPASRCWIRSTLLEGALGRSDTFIPKAAPQPRDDG